VTLAGKRDGHWTGHGWVAAEPRRNGFDLRGYQDDTPRLSTLEAVPTKKQLEKLADQFILGDPEIINSLFFSKKLPVYSLEWRCRIES
jgi:hypothetical protein